MSHRKSFIPVLVVAGSSWLAAASAEVALADSDPPAPPGAVPKTANPIQPIVKRMQAAQSRLKQGDTGAETRTIQEQVVRDLDKLIDAAARQSSSGQGAQKSPSQGQQSQGSDERAGQQPQQGKQGQPAGGQATNSGPTTGRNGSPRRPQPKKIPASSDRSSLVREVWGHLPPAVRENVRVDFSETVLPAYDELVRQYFEALLEAAPTRRGSTTSPKAPAPPEQLPPPAGTPN
jgi:hypothetical protein